MKHILNKHSEKLDEHKVGLSVTAASPCFQGIWFSLPAVLLDFRILWRQNGRFLLHGFLRS